MIRKGSRTVTNKQPVVLYFKRSTDTMARKTRPCPRPLGATRQSEAADRDCALILIFSGTLPSVFWRYCTLVLFVRFFFLPQWCKLNQVSRLKLSFEFELVDEARSLLLLRKRSAQKAEVGSVFGSHCSSANRTLLRFGKHICVACHVSCNVCPLWSICVPLSFVHTDTKIGEQNMTNTCRGFVST